MTSSFTNLVVRGSTKISLHDRFTELRKISVSSSVRSPPSLSTHSNVTASRDFSSTNGRPQNNLLLRRMKKRPPPVVEAALKIKRRSLKFRLGRGYYPPRQNFGTHYFHEVGRGDRGRIGVSSGVGRRRNRLHFMGRFNNGRKISRQTRTTSGANGSFRGGGGGGGGGVGGIGVGRRGMFYRRGRNRWNYTRGAGNRFSRGRGGFHNNKPPTKEELDAQLDSYMSSTKTVLDKQLDTYMEEPKS